MIVVSPPVVAPYAPSNQPIASVKLLRVSVDPDRGGAFVNVQLYDANGRNVVVNAAGIPAFDANAQAAFLAVTAQAGESTAHLLQRAFLPFLNSAYGLTGTIQ